MLIKHRIIRNLGGRTMKYSIETTENGVKKKTDMSFEMSEKGMISFACEHKEMTFSQNLTR